jgi:hypothetical protein
MEFALKIILSILALMNISQRKLDIPDSKINEYWNEK